MIDAKGIVLDRFEVGHDRAGLAALVVMSFPRAGRVCAAQIRAELGDVRARFPSEDQLAAEAGVAPVTYQSGKSRGVGWRWACNQRLRAGARVLWRAWTDRVPYDSGRHKGAQTLAA